jgi:hypothetical protein
VVVSGIKVALENGFTNHLVADLSEPLVLCTLNCTNDVDCAVLNGFAQWFASGSSFSEKYIDQTDILFDQQDHVLYTSYKLSALKSQNVELVRKTS